MMFSLARGGYAPKALGRLSPTGVPRAALFVSSIGMIAAVPLATQFKDTDTYIGMLGAAFFGGLYAWMMIFVTHLAFRRKHHAPEAGATRFAPPGPWSSLAGLTALTAVLISTWFIPGMRICITAGLPWLVFVSLCYVGASRSWRGNPHLRSGR
jgi:L-asparagine transporter-like permease